MTWRGENHVPGVGDAVHMNDPFTPRAQRERHRVTLDHLWCDDIGEDAVSIQPRAIVTIRRT